MKREEIRKKAKEKYEKPRTLWIDEIGIEIIYYPITVEFEEHMKSKFDGKPNVNENTWAIEAIMYRALDEDGKRIWTTDEDREFLRKKIPSPILTRIMRNLSGIGLEEAKKKSKTARS